MSSREFVGISMGVSEKSEVIEDMTSLSLYIVALEKCHSQIFRKSVLKRIAAFRYVRADVLIRFLRFCRCEKW